MDANDFGEIISVESIEQDTRTGPIKVNGKYYKQKFKRSWLEDKSFSEWLQPVQNNQLKAYCVVCDTELHAKRYVLDKHASCARHKFKLRTAKSAPRPPQRRMLTVGGIIKSVVPDGETRDPFVTWEERSEASAPSSASDVEKKMLKYYKKKFFEKANAYLSLQMNKHSNENDEVVTFCKHIGNELQKMTADQLIQAKRLITQITYLGSTGKLFEDTVVKTDISNNILDSS